MAKKLRDYLPDNVQGKVFEGDYEGRKENYLVWEISCDTSKGISRASVPPAMPVCLLSNSRGVMMDVELHLDDPVVSEESPEGYAERIAQNNTMFMPDTQEIEKVRKLLERKAAEAKK